MKYEEILRKLHIDFIFPQEVIWLDKGIKNVLRKGFSGDETEIRRLCSFIGFEYMIVKEEPKFGLSMGRVVYISKNREMNKEAHKAYAAGDKRRVGELLSYPSCCITSHLLGESAIDVKYDFDKLPFYTNMLHNMETRLKDKKDFDTWLLLQKKGWRLTNIFLIPHIPCSFKCEKSAKIGRETFKILKNEIITAEHYKRYLKTGVLYFDKFEYTTIKIEEISKEKDYICYKYDGIPNLIPEDKIELIKRGVILRKKGESFIVEDAEGNVREIKNLKVFLFDKE